MTEPQHPPAGWYPDPQDATQQRYWDGSTWTGHTAPQGGATAAPVGAAPAEASVPAAGAPAWTAPMAGADPGAPAKKSWFKRPIFLIPIGIVVGLFVLGIVLALVNGTDHSKDLANAIKTDGQSQLQTLWSQQLPGSTVKVTDVSCVEKSNSQEYTCLIHMAVTYQGETKTFIQSADGSCDKKVNAHCLWHTTDSPQQSSS